MAEAGHDDALVGGSGSGELSLEFLRHPLVVVVEERDPGPSRRGDARVPRISRSHRDGMLDHAQTVVRDERQRFDRHRIRTIDDYDELEFSHGLRQDALDGLRHELRAS